MNTSLDIWCLSVIVGLFSVQCTDWAFTTDGVYTPNCAHNAGTSLRACSRTAPTSTSLDGPTLTTVPLIVERTRLIAAAQNSLVGIDLATAARDVISGDYVVSNGATTSTTEGVGAGPAFGSIVAMQKAPDGSYEVVGTRYVTGGLSMVITRVDPISGDRIVVDDISRTRCHAAGFTLNLEPSAGFIITPDGARYFPVSGIDEWSHAGYGLARVTGGECELISFVGGVGGGTVGGGPEWRGPLSSVQFARGAVWGIDAVGREMVRIDPETGARILYHAPDSVLATAWSDPQHGLLAVADDGAWSRTGTGAGVERFDPDTEATSDATSDVRFPSSTPGVSGTFTTLAADPTRPLLYASSGNAVLVIHRVTGRTSWLVPD